MLILSYILQQSPDHYQLEDRKHYIVLCLTVFVAQKCSNEVPEQLICNKVFLGDIFKKN